jgi:hypothetical protein
MTAGWVVLAVIAASSGVTGGSWSESNNPLTGGFANCHRAIGTIPITAGYLRAATFPQDPPAFVQRLPE